MDQKEIVWVEFPFSDFGDTKVRPALIISKNVYNKITEDIVVCAITSKLKEVPYSINLEMSDVVDGTLPIRSRIRADKIMHIKKSSVIRPIAKVNNSVFDKVVEKIINLIKRDINPS